MSVHTLLNKLSRVKANGKSSWRACCPAHGGHKQTLAVKDDNGIVLLHCFAEGCSIIDVLGAVGLDMNDIMPKAQGEKRSQPKPFYAGDVLQIASDEILVAYLIVKKMLDGTVNFNDMERLRKCSSRLQHACEIGNKGNGVVLAEALRDQRILEGLIHAE